jgi:hypothetical protein
MVLILFSLLSMSKVNGLDFLAFGLMVLVDGFNLLPF